MKIIMPTVSHHEHFVPHCIRALQHFLPDDPEVIVFSDLGDFVYPNKVISAKHEWVSMMHDCVVAAMSKKMLSLDDHIVLMLEDHIPHSFVSQSELLTLSKFLRAGTNTYLNLAAHGQGEVVTRLDGVSIHRMKLHTFSSLHPALWSVRHLLKTLQFALENNQLSPWQ